eukprot:3862526-Amphidinium_carterae.1
MLSELQRIGLCDVMVIRVGVVIGLRIIDLNLRLLCLIQPKHIKLLDSARYGNKTQSIPLHLLGATEIKSRDTNLATKSRTGTGIQRLGYATNSANLEWPR